MENKFLNYTEKQTDAYIKKVSGIVREYLATKSKSSRDEIISIDDLHTSVFQNLLNNEADVEGKILDNKTTCMDLLKLLANPTVNILLDKSSSEAAIELLSNTIDFYESLDWYVTLAIMHLTFIEQFGQGDLEAVAYWEKDYALKLALAKHEKNYELQLS